MFKQLIQDGYQAEVPDIWLTEGNPWEIKRNDIRFEVGFSGKTITDKGKTTWLPGESVRLCAEGGRAASTRDVLADSARRCQGASCTSAWPDAPSLPAAGSRCAPPAAHTPAS